MRRFLFAFLVLICTATQAQADVFRSAELSLARGEEEGVYEFTALIPQSVDGPLAIEWPEGCEQASTSRSSVGANAIYAITLECRSPIGAGDTISAPWVVDGATFTSNLAGTPVRRTIAGSNRGLEIPISAETAAARPFDETAVAYGWQGIVHIWMGWDHLAFVLCLCLIARGRQLVGLVTAFTIGHSISLALAFFELVTIPIMPVEAIIALSIVFMAREALLVSRTEDQNRRMKHYVTIVSLFGLLHGLGFASALEDLGVVDGERVPGLIFFNVGVETGQLIFVGLVTAVLSLLRRVDAVAPVRTAALCGVGVLGGFWVVERVAGFTGIA